MSSPLFTLATAMGGAVSNDAGFSNVTGIWQLLVWGTPGGGTAKLQVSPDGTNWIDYDGASGAAAFTFSPIYIAAGVRVRLATAGGTGSSWNATLAPLA